jgi:ABC-2 type transport system ATP-binding protein
MIATDLFASEAVIDVRGVTRRFGARRALDDVSLTVPRGSVFGLVGANGAGETTLIKHVLGLLRAASGSVRVFGRDPVANPAGVLGRIGYLAEENDLPGWMRVDELLHYTRAFYPNWDDAYAAELSRTFALDPAARIKNLSKGQQARTSLVAALAHRPPLLVLDEPSSGLDPIVRRDILGTIIQTIAEEGRTVLFSSHLLDEVERVSDHMAMIDRGRVVFCGELDEIKERHRRLTLHFEAPRAAPPALAGALVWEGSGREWSAVWAGTPAEFQRAAEAGGARLVEERTPSLDEIFVAQARTRCLVSSEG